LGQFFEEGWAIGSKEHYYIETFSTIINEIVYNIEILPKEITFIGALTGGFTSMAMADHISVSLCI